MIQTINSNQIIKTIRKIRSFVLRQGRLTQRQHFAIENYWSKYGIDFAQNHTLDFSELFGNNNPTILEIGFGMGISLITMAKNNPHLNYLGIEVHTPGVGNCLAEIKLENLDNIKIMSYDAIEVLHHMIKDQSLHGLQLFFPDPWQKNKHHKRRIVQKDFLELVISKLQTNGFIHMATDWKDYAKHMLRELNNTNLYNTSPTNDYIEKPDNRPITKFENRGHNLGHGVWDLYFIKNK